ncbi:MAG TPA: DUF3515 domain-containing protein [Mycobacteriales bacterium]|nr:DUF3515 domain-containing protein [Mycobacteriales bacterium]
MPTATDEHPVRDRSDRRSAARLATLVALPVTLVLVVLAVALGRGGNAQPVAPTATPSAAAALPPVKVAPPPALSAAAQQSCQELIAALPTDLGDIPARPVDSSSPYVAAWGDPAITLRCGVARPPSFIATADVQQINGVSWFAERRGSTTAWVVVDRPVYVEVLVPAADAGGPAARLSTAVIAALRPRPLDPAN